MNIEELETELATRRGFLARVEPRAGLRNVGLFLGVLGLLAALGGVVKGRAVDGLLGLAFFLALGLAVVLLGLLKERWAMGRLHADYLARGWVSLQAPTGLVVDNTGDSTLVRRGHGLDPEPDRGGRELGEPVVLVGSRGQTADEVEAAAVAVRADLMRMSKAQASQFAWGVRSQGLYGDGDAARLFSAPEGMLCTVQKGRSPFMLVIPAVEGVRRQHPDFYGIRPVRGSHPPVAQRTG